MKKTLLMAIAAVLIWTGCSEEDALNSSRQGLSSISAVIEQNPGNSRVQVNENNEGGLHCRGLQMMRSKLLVI